MSIRAGGRIKDRGMRKMIDRWIAEATECDFKVSLEVKKPKSWLKSVSAFANGIGGTLFFGIDDDRNVIGLSDAQTNAETISRLIKERITPYPSFVLAPERESGKDILVLSVSSGRSTPCCGSGIRRGQATAWKKSCSIPSICGTNTAS